MGVFIFPAKKFNMLCQKYLGLQCTSHLKGLQLANITAEDIKKLIGAGIPEAFYQQDINSGNKGELIAFKTTFG